MSERRKTRARISSSSLPIRPPKSGLEPIPPNKEAAGAAFSSVVSELDSWGISGISVIASVELSS